MTNSTTSGGMTPWLHFGDNDYLIFEAWRASSSGAVAGACIGLFLFCILERFLAAYRRSQELRWRSRAILMSARACATSGNEDSTQASRERSTFTRRRLVPPFIPSHDIPRGAIQTIQSTFSYTLMLAVMTFNAAYIISIILGLGAGEVLVGRIGRLQLEPSSLFAQLK